MKGIDFGGDQGNTNPVLFVYLLFCAMILYHK